MPPPSSFLVKPVIRLAEYSGVVKSRNRLRAMGRRNSVFVWIPKNAGSSFFDLYERYGHALKCKTLHMARWRFPQRGHVSFGHMDYAALVQKGFVSNHFDRTAFKFCFSRNPYARAVSLYFYLHDGRRDFNFLDFCRSLAENGARPIGLFNRDADSQCNPQVRWIEQLKMDYVARVETIDSDVAKILSAIGLQWSAPKVLNTTRHDVYGSYYCRESRDIIADFYAEDFREFSYPMDVLDSSRGCAVSA